MNSVQNKLLSTLEHKISDLEIKIQEIIKRLDKLQKNSLSTPPQQKTPSNQFFRHIAPQLPSPTAIRPSKHKNQDQFKWKSHDRWFSHRDKSESPSQLNLRPYQTKSIDSKSFNIIKQSILLNSQQVYFLKDRIIQIERSFHDKMLRLEQGFQIMTRLTVIIQENYEKLNKNDENNKDSQRSKQSITDKLLNKYLNPQSQHKKKY